MSYLREDLNVHYHKRSFKRASKLPFVSLVNKTSSKLICTYLIRFTLNTEDIDNKTKTSVVLDIVI